MDLTDAYPALGDMDNAIWAYEQIEHGKDLDRINRLLDLHMQKRDWTRALELAKRIREIETPPHRRFLEVVNRVLREEPDLPAAFNAMLNHLEEVGPAGELHRWRERLLAKQPQNIALRRKVIEHLREADDPVAYDRHLSAILEGPDSTVDDMIEMIESLTQRQDWEALDQWLTRAKEAHPDTWEFVLAEAQLALVRGRHDECFRLCHMARARARTEAQIKSVEELLVRLERARSENALDSLREAIAESADPMPLRWELVQRLISAKAFDQATNELDEILRRDPRQSERVHQTLGDLLEKNPKSFALLTFSRDLNAREGRHDEVLAITKRMAEQSLTPDVVMRECCERILNANPEHVDSLRWLAEDALRSENWEEGVALLDRWFRCDPAAGDDPVNLWRLFSGHCAQENVERAEKVAQRLIDAKHRELDTLRDLSRLYERHGQLVQAHQCALRARNLAPDDLNVRDAVKRLDAGIRADRVQELEQLIAAKPNDTVLHHELGDLLYSFERYTEAIPHLQRAAGDPARANLCRAKIAHSLGQRGMLDLAHESLQDVTIEADNPDDLETLKAIHYNLAEIFREEDHIERAREIFKRLFRVDAGYRNVVQKLEKLTH
jgi:tetratricopeptide (TPR) repeat protein